MNALRTVLDEDIERLVTSEDVMDVCEVVPLEEDFADDVQLDFGFQHTTPVDRLMEDVDLGLAVGYSFD